MLVSVDVELVEGSLVEEGAAVVDDDVDEDVDEVGPVVDEVGPVVVVDDEATVVLDDDVVDDDVLEVLPCGWSSWHVMTYEMSFPEGWT